MGRRWLRLAVVIVVVAALTGVPWAVATLSPVGSPWPRVLRAEPLHCLNEAIDRYGRSGDGWSGGDSTWTTALPDDRELFAFSDTFLSATPGSERPGSAPFVNNSFVVRDANGRMRTIVGGTREQPTAVLTPAEPGSWFWLGAATYLGGALQVPLGQWRSSGTGPFDWEFGGSSVARFAPNDLTRPTSITPLRDTRDIQWGQWVAPAGEYTFLYGVRGAGALKQLHVARVRGADLRAPLEFFDGKLWRFADENGRGPSTPIATGVSGELSVHRLRDGVYLMVTTEGGPGLSDRIVGRYASSPIGPFGAPQLFYRTPETGAGGTYRDPDVYTYNAHAHPEFSTSNRVVISYNVNSVDTAVGGDVYRDTTIYRPRFITVTLDGPGPGAPAPARPPCR